MPLNISDEQRKELEQLEYHPNWDLFALAPEKGDPESELECAWNNLTHYHARLIYQHAVNERDNTYREINIYISELLNHLNSDWIFRSPFYDTVWSRSTPSSIALEQYPKEIKKKLLAWGDLVYPGDALKKSIWKLIDILYDAIYKRKDVFRETYVRVLRPGKRKKLQAEYRKTHYVPIYEEFCANLYAYAGACKKAITEKRDEHISCLFRHLCYYPRATIEVLEDEQPMCLKRTDDAHCGTDKHHIVRKLMLRHRQLEKDLPDDIDPFCMRLVLDFLCVPEYLEHRHPEPITVPLSMSLENAATYRTTQKKYEDAHDWIKEHFSAEEFKYDLDDIPFGGDNLEEHAELRKHIDELRTKGKDDKHNRVAETAKLKARIQHQRKTFQEMCDQVAAQGNDAVLTKSDIEEEIVWLRNKMRNDIGQIADEFVATWGSLPDDPELSKLLQTKDE